MTDRVSALATVIRDASAAVDAAAIPEKRHAPAFEMALKVLIAEAGLLGPSHPPEASAARPTINTSTGRDSQSEVDGDPLARIAAKAQITVEQVKEVYRLDGPELSLVVGAKLIDSNKAGGARQITLLLAGGRQAAGFEEWTRTAQTRDACVLYNRFDSSNYASTVTSMAQFFNFHGKGANREIRLTMPGWEEWAALVQGLIGDGAK